MTRNADLRLEDLRGCDHSAETPIVEGSIILYWVCRCGAKKTYPDELEASSEAETTNKTED